KPVQSSLSRTLVSSRRRRPPFFTHGAEPTVMNRSLHFIWMTVSSNLSIRTFLRPSPGISAVATVGPQKNPAAGPNGPADAASSRVGTLALRAVDGQQQRAVACLSLFGRQCV